MAGYVRFALGEGIASARYAYVNGSNIRYPSDGYYSTSTGTALSNVDHLYIYDIVFESGYYSWSAVYGSSSLYGSGSNLPTSGTSTTVNINIYPSSSTTSDKRATVTISSTSASNTYTLQYRSNDGGTILHTVNGTSYTGSYTFTIQYSPTPPDQYHYFAGWAVAQNSTNVIYKYGETVTTTGTTSLYAVFERYTPTIYKQVWYRESTSESYSWQKTDQETATAGYSYTPSSHIPTYNANYELTQIVDSNGTDYTTGSFIVPTGGATLIYRFTRRQLTAYLYYNANGGSGGPNTQSGTVSSGGSYSFKIPNTEPTRGGYIFQGWAESSGAAVPSYYAGDRYSVTAGGSATLWAVWARAYTHTLSYDANGGSGTPGAESVTDTNNSCIFTVSYTTPTRANYDFLGWANSSSATEAECSGGDRIEVVGSRTLYAVWRDQKKAKAPEATFTVTAKGTDNLTIRVTQSNLEAGVWSFQISTDSSFGIYISAGLTAAYSTASLSSSFTELSANTVYYVRAYNTYNGTTLYAVLNGYARTNIAAFAWTANDSAYVVSGAIPRAAITAAKWNALGAKIDEVSRRQGTGSVPYSSVSPAQRITAALFNAARNTIAARGGASGTPSAQSKGAGMKASLFIALKDAINGAVNYTNLNF